METSKFTKHIDVENTWFQQDGATQHTVRVSMAAVRRLCSNRVIFQNTVVDWPPRSSQTYSYREIFFYDHIQSVSSTVLLQMPKDHTRPQNLRFIEKLNKILPGRLCHVTPNFKNLLAEYIVLCEIDDINYNNYVI